MPPLLVIFLDSGSRVDRKLQQPITAGTPPELNH